MFSAFWRLGVQDQGASSSWLTDGCLLAMPSRGGRERDVETERRQSLGDRQRSRDRERGRETGQRWVGEKCRGRRDTEV